MFSALFCLFIRLFVFCICFLYYYLLVPNLLLHNLIEFVMEIMRVIIILVVVAVYIVHIISWEKEKGEGGYAKLEHSELHLV